MNRKRLPVLFANPRNRLFETGKRFRDKIRKALGKSMRRVFGKRGSIRRKISNIALTVIFSVGCGATFYNSPEARKLAVIFYSKAESLISSLTSETLESSTSTSTLDSINRPKYIYFIMGVICIVANSILWQYDENGQISYRFHQRVPEPEKTPYLLKIAEEIYDYFPEPLSQLLVLVVEIGGIFVSGFVLFADMEHKGPISSLVDSIIDLFN